MAWTSSLAITISHLKVPNTDQANFPVLFTGAYKELRGTSFGGNVTNANGFDIIFASDSAGASPLPFERVAYIPQSGAVEFWIKIATLSHTTDTVIYILFGNSAITTDQATPASVWTNAFGLVMHYGTPSAFSLTDSTGVNTASQTGIGAPQMGEIAGAAGPFSSSATTYVRVTNNASFKPSTAITLQCWIKPSAQTQYGKVICLDFAGNGTWGAPYCAYGLEYNSTAYQLAFQPTPVGSTTSPVLVGTTAIPLNVWTSYAVTWDTTSLTVKFYYNGAPDGTQAWSATGINYGTSQDLTIGARSPYSISNAETMPGLYDEIRISSVARSADWIATEYNNQSSPSTFYSSSLTPNTGAVLWGPWPAAASVFVGATNVDTGIGHQPVRAPASFATPVSNFPVPVGAALKGGIIGVAYSEAITVQGGASPYSFAVTSGALPTGTSLNSSSGIISGTPTATGAFSFTITVTDTHSNTGSQSFTINVGATAPPNYGYVA